MSIELKIKSKHLALEPSIIKNEEFKLRKQIKWYKEDVTKLPLEYKLMNLTQHRCVNVRNEARATYLARAYMKNVPYKNVEFKRNDDHIFNNMIVPRIFSMVAKYGNTPIRKYWSKGVNDYRPEEKETLMNSILEWCKID